MENLSFFSNLGSADKRAREAAEQQFQAAQKSRPYDVASGLLQVIEQQRNGADELLALVLLRQTLKLDWSFLGLEDRKGELAGKLMQLLTISSNENVNKQIIAAFIALPKPALKRFTPQVIQIVASNSRTGLYLAESFAEFAYSEEIVQPFVTTLKAFLENGTAVSVQDQLLAVKASVALVLAANEANEVDVLRQFACLLPGSTIRIVARAIVERYQDTGSVETVMEALVSLSDSCGWALDSSLGENCAMLLDICANKDVSASIRALSMTVFGSVMARKGSSASKDAAFSSRAIEVMLQMQLQDEEFESDFNDDTSPDHDDMLGLSQSGPRGAALDALSQLAYGAAGKNADANALLAALLGRVQPLLTSPDWRARIAALSAVAVISSPLEKPLKALLGDICAGVSRMLSEDPHERVRFAAAGCLCSLLDASKKIARELRKSMHSFIIGGIVKAITENESKDPVATRCAVLIALMQFYGGTSRKGDAAKETGTLNDDDEAAAIVVPKAAVRPYVDGLVQCLVGVLQKSSEPAVQEATMEALTAIGTQAGEEFGKYYNVLVPGIKTVLQNTREPGVKTAAMILVATCAETVDKTVFAKDAQEVVGWILTKMQQQQANLGCNKEESSELESLFHFCERVAAVLQADFAPFMPHILPLACNAAVADLAISVAESQATTDARDHLEQDEATGQATAVAKLRGVGNLEVSANIYAFQLRESAITLIDALAESGSMAPEHLNDCVNALIPNISERACTATLNAAAAEAAGSVFNASCNCADASVPTRVLVALATPILAALAFEASQPYSSDEMDRRSAFASAIERMSRICYLSKGRVKVPAELIPHVVQVLMNALSGSLTRRTNYVEDLKAAGFEPDAIQAIGEDITEEEAGLASDLVDATGYLLKTDPATVWPQFVGLVLPFMSGFVDIDTHGDVNFNHNALCCFVDALEFGPEDGRVAQACLPNLKKALTSSEPKLRQVGAYGLGVCAQKLVSSSDWIEDVVKALVKALNSRDSQEEAMVEATENVSSALGRFYVRTGNEDIKKAFAQSMPIVNDEAEAEFAHALLFKLELAGQLNGFEPRVVLTCAMILQHRAHQEEEISLCNDETFALVPQVLASVKSRIGVDAYKALVASLAADAVDDEIKQQMASL